jgi:predicted phosphohydrolase
MRILVTADLHYDIGRSRGPAERLARDVCAQPADALVLVGDTAGANLDTFVECLNLFAGFVGRKLLVPGNHCLWCREDENSLDRYERMLPAAAEEAGFTVLDHHPAAVGGVGLVGSIGWYDYSFRDESLGVPEAFYRAKVSPGAAAYLNEPLHQRLIEAHRDELGKRQMALGVRWMDGWYVRLGLDDEEFVDLLADKLARQVASLSPEVRQIIAFVHHLPFRELVPRNRPDLFAFGAAFMGAQRLGDVLLACPKVTHVFCGHSHWPDRRRIDHITVVNIGSTYTQKRLEVLDV